MFFSKPTIKIITVVFLFGLIYSMKANTLYTVSGNFIHNYTNYKYDITNKFNRYNLKICQNNSCHTFKNYNHYNDSEMALFEKTFNTNFNMTKQYFDKMATENIKIRSEIAYPESYIIYIFTFICVLLFF